MLSLILSMINLDLIGYYYILKLNISSILINFEFAVLLIEWSHEFQGSSLIIYNYN
jgi:hypothetical protein